MKTQKNIEQAIAMGGSAQRTIELVLNWCAHVRVQKVGGMGLIERQTGLPIGPHSLTCPHASAPGIAAADLGAVALDFHDRNCAGCSNRKPVRLPNLSILLAKRAADRAAEAAETAHREAEHAAKLSARNAARQILRANLEPPSSDVVDQIEELDRSRNLTHADRLLKTAELAPEVFTPTLLNYAFGLLESREIWFDGAGLRLLKALKADPVRLTRCALLCLSRHSAIETAAVILLGNLQLVDKALIAGAIPALIWLASQRSTLMLGDGDRRRRITAPLLRLYKVFPKVTESAIAGLLDRPDTNAISAAARGIAVLARRDSALPVRYARTLTSKLVRDHRLLNADEFDGGDGEIVSEVRQALALAFEAAPVEVDKQLGAFLEGASEDGEARAFSLYREVLRPVQFDNREVTEAARIALKRVIWHSSRTERLEVLKEIQNIISGRPWRLSRLAAEEVEGLLGSAILLDDKLGRLDVPSPLHDPTGSAGLERYNRQIVLEQLREGLVFWAAAGAGETPLAARTYCEVLGSLPTEGRDTLKNDMVRHLNQLMGTTDGLNAALPHLYVAMVGTSVKLRASAAYAIGELGVRQQDNMPSLVFEAFTALLMDPYKAVHMMAVHALPRLHLPDSFGAQVRLAIFVLILTYGNAHDGKDDRFLADCLRLYIDQFAKPEEFDAKFGEWVLSLLLKIEPYVVAHHIVRFGRVLRTHDRLIELMARLTLDDNAWQIHGDAIGRAFGELPVNVVQRQVKVLEGLAHSPKVQHRRVCGFFIELFTRARCWDAAGRLAQSVVEAIPDDTWNRPRRLVAQQMRVAADFEAALAAGALDRVSALSGEWKKIENDIEEDRIENEKRRDPLWGLRSQN
jgi:hypothetical protein